MAKTHRYAENANKNGNESIVFLDKEISEKIFFYSYIDDYQSVKRKNDSYKTGIPAVFAYLMELLDIKNEEMAEVARITCSTFRSWKSGKKKPDRISLIRFCIRFKLDYYNSCDFLKLFGYCLSPEKVYNGYEVIFNRDYYVASFLNCYRFLSIADLKKTKKEYPADLSFLFD